MIDWRGEEEPAQHTIKAVRVELEMIWLSDGYFHLL